MDNQDEVLKKYSTDWLIDIRILARECKNYFICDKIRDELDSRGSFCMDSPNGQIVYHMGKGWTRKMLIARINEIDDNFRAKRI